MKAISDKVSGGEATFETLDTANTDSYYVAAMLSSEAGDVAPSDTATTCGCLNEMFGMCQDTSGEVYTGVDFTNFQVQIQNMNDQEGDGPGAKIWTQANEAGEANEALKT